MKLIGTVLDFLRSKGLVEFYKYVLFSVNGNPFIKAHFTKGGVESCNIFFTASFGKEIKEGTILKELELKKCVVWEGINSKNEKVYRIGKMDAINTYLPYEELKKENTDLKYLEKLRAAEWRDKRQHIIDRESGVCEICKRLCISDLEYLFESDQSKSSNIQERWANVHHTYYVKGSLPWHYPNESLRLLCSGCHQKLHMKAKVNAYMDHRYLDSLALQDCSKCNSLGYLPEYYYYYNGVCFNCDGTGYTNLR